jgi:hypothetical protein
METRVVENEAVAKSGQNLVQQIGNHATMVHDLKTFNSEPLPVAPFRSAISMSS